MKGSKPLIYWLILLFFAVILSLEYATPAEYVFGYFYIVPIVLASYKLTKKATLRLTLIGVGLTLSNLVFPQLEIETLAITVNRLIAVLALWVTGSLAVRIRQYEEEINRQQAQLQAQQQLAAVREDFISTLTHDLKTPLLGAIETIKGIKAGLFGEITPQHQKVLEMMLRSHRSSLELVQTLLDVYRNDIEGIQLQCEPVNLASIAAEVIATLTNLAATRQVYVVLSCGDSDFRTHFWVNGDVLQLQRVFSNLIINGINHSPRGGRVEVKLETEGDFQLVKILDNGQGITPNELPHLFERFYQGTGDRQASGTGLGLYLTRQIITAHGGKIWAANRSPMGAIFIFCLKAIPLPNNDLN
ncbi:sensor histidine kinase [Gloeothece verrucosa]|uniref:histidine kinase n=1 Tax=Gloeothece verrucosa (strain PCC 7822) TaxID=497965 RepID=E0UCQ5_GLOV7|nr:HAMP domain-containing sensor histidine kinase [Gloeothece verrucosa]ADN15249.1 integral membrane sensor signal transduction histidine kinase [Gloeothece verrucosa PCC 7822]